VAGKTLHGARPNRGAHGFGHSDGPSDRRFRVGRSSPSAMADLEEWSSSGGPVERRSRCGQNSAYRFTALKVSSWQSLIDTLNAGLSKTIIIHEKPQSNQNFIDTHIPKTTVVLEPDVAEMFPTSEAVNEALRFLIRVTSKKILV